MQLRVIVLGAVLMMCCSATAGAQDTRRVGVTMGYPASVGLLWHISDRVALRPEISFTWTSLESAPNTGFELFETGTESDSQQSTIGVSALFYLARWESLRAYVTPRIAYTRSSATTELSITPPPSFFEPLPPLDTETESTSSGMLFSGGFGAQYWLGERFSVYGEFGVSFTRTTTETEVLTFRNESRVRSVGTRSGVGVVFYF